MSLLDDQHLNALLYEAREISPTPSRVFEARVMTAYRERQRTSVVQRWLLIHEIRIPFGAGLLLLLSLILAGVGLDRGLFVAIQHRESGTNPTRQWPQPEFANDVDKLTFKELQPVTELKPRLVQDNQL